MFEMTGDLQQLLFLLVVGFAYGYIVRELIAGRQHTPARASLALSPWLRPHKWRQYL
jgi:H+/Cl- antiporter ClcA